MYNRYNDLKKFITASSELKIVNGSEVYISSEKNYGIVVDLGKEQVDEFEKLKPFISLIVNNICKLDNTAQQFNSLRYKENQFPYDLEVICINEPNMINFVYWGNYENTQFDVIFEYKNNEFVLKSFGMLNNIPPDWCESSSNRL